MNRREGLTLENCKNFQPEDFLVRLDRKEGIPPHVAEILDPPPTPHFAHFDLPAGLEVKLHFHDYDEHWMFASGTSDARIRLPDGRSLAFETCPGLMVVTPKGLEHGHVLRTPMTGFEMIGARRDGVRPGHLYREVSFQKTRCAWSRGRACPPRVTCGRVRHSSIERRRKHVTLPGQRRDASKREDRPCQSQ